MNLEICRQCPVNKCKLFFDESKHQVIVLEETDYSAFKLLNASEESCFLADLWKSATTVVGKNGNRLVYEKMTLPPDAPQPDDFEVKEWDYDDYFSDTEYTRMWCPCWSEQLVVFLSNKEKKDEQGSL